MRWSPLAPVRRARRQVREDLAADPYLAYILLLAALLMSFWLWHRLPNFATRDERWRVVDFMEVIGALQNDFTFESFQGGLLYWRSYGATMYLYGLVSLPFVALAFLTGDGEVFGEIGYTIATDLYAHWQNFPGWLWTGSVLAARIVNALFAVGCVYLLYRIGTTLRDRATGRLVALLMTLTWALVVLAHEAGEDVPALFCMLLTLYYGIRYIENGSPRTFLAGSAVGGLAMAFKISAGLAGILLGVAYLLRVRRAEDPWAELLPARVAAAVALPLGLVGIGWWQGGPTAALGGLLMGLGLVAIAVAVLTPGLDPDVLGTLREPDRPALAHLFIVLGPLVAGVVLFVGFPSALFNGPEVIANRIGRGVNGKATPHGWLDRPNWWWLLRSSVNGLGWPLFLAGIAAVGASLTRLRERTLETDGVVLALVGTGLLLLIASRWEYARTHHLLPIFPLVVLLVGIALQRLSVSRGTVARGLAAVLLVSTAVYTGVGTLGYATQPRDQAVSWLQNEGGPNGTVETYAFDPQEAAVPHGWTIYRPSNRPDDLSKGDWMEQIEARCPEFVVLNYQRSMLWLAPDNHSVLAERWANVRATAFVRDLLATEGPYETDAAPYPYEVAREFGPQPVFLDETPQPLDPTWNAVRAGIFPRTIQYGDPQDMGYYQYAIVLERSGTCNPP